ncbi:LPS assembly protein LptD [Bombella sp. TMW 2.2543]|uniref:LPS-assembly protein LptD n=1 Tax=Bombella pluederhausensis TaxID=2967336 RepID=A0ABT3WGR5_9PROT|nr:LPS assembly protein LptD [Bombella pluederhausensis]MCX5618264.1 LPS assembly protein LptD [Bombella pluederhausensis]
MPLSDDFPFRRIGKPRSLLSQALAGSTLGALLHVIPAASAQTPTPAQTSTQPPQDSAAQAKTANVPSSLKPPQNARTLPPRTKPDVSADGQVSSSEPVTYLADHESYDRTGLLVLEGNVRLWQGDQTMRADKVTYDRAAGVIEAIHHVALTQPDGTTAYADHLELSHGMKDAVSSQLYVNMPNDAKLASSGMRRSNGRVMDFANPVYTACPVCAQHPDRPPTWDLKAHGVTQDKDNQNLEFDRAWLHIMGVPVFYFPYLPVTDPSSERHSGLLNLNIKPHDHYLGTVFSLPYYWVIDGHQDATFTPLVSTKSGPQLSTVYRNRLNNGYIRFEGGVADDTLRKRPFYNAFGELSNGGKEHGAQAYIASRGEFNLSPHWRVGFNANRATSANYMRDYSLPGYGNDTLNSNAYLEGFGVGSYLRLDTQVYQGLNQGIINNRELPYSLPRFTYEFQGEPDALGGRLSVHTTDFVVLRERGANDQRGELALQWDRPWTNSWGQQWLLTARVDSMIYHSTRMHEQPLYEQSGSHVQGQAQPTVAAKVSWPFLRSFAKGHGTQVFEPIVQLIAAPNTGNALHRQLPNEDSFAYELNDTTLFALNRYMGTDRLDGGLRANVGIHQNWSWNGRSIDMLIGESFIEHPNKGGPAYMVYSGVNHTFSDPVGRIQMTPSRYFDLTARGRFNPYSKSFDYGEGLVSAGLPFFRVMAGYVYEPITSYYYYYSPHDSRLSSLLNNPYLNRTSEISGGVTGRWKSVHFAYYTRRSLSRKEFVANGGTIGYSNDCITTNIYVSRQNTRIGGRRPNLSFGFSISLKSLGTFGN